MNKDRNSRLIAVAVASAVALAITVPTAVLGTSPSSEGASAAVSAGADMPIAEFYKEQWNLKAIHADPAVASPAMGGSEDVLVAVLDTGIDYLHPDRVGRFDLDPARSISLLDTSCPSTDPGTPYNRTPIDENATADALPRNRIMDFHSHGTAVSALIASNAEFLAGVTRRTTLFSVKVHGATRQNCLSVYLKGIEEAADRGADVIHLSIPLMFDRTRTADIARVNASLTYAYKRGAVLVTPAGNDGVNVNLNPRFRFCEGNPVICVSGTGPASPDQIHPPYWDEPAANTNFGAAIDVAAPGGTGPALTPIVPVRLDCSSQTVLTAMPKASDVCIDEASRTWLSTGSSFGAAATSGLAALIVSIIGKDKPGQVEDIIKASADDLGGEGIDPYYGYGRINVAKAIALANAYK
jgi:lantibiotic leader peptide-processing serine protease